MANETVVQASQQASGGLPVEPVVAAAVILMTLLIGGGIYLYFNDKKYNYITRVSAWISQKISAEEDTKGIQEDELEEQVEEVVEENNTEVNVTTPDELFKAIESFGEEKEHAGRQEERKKQREDENLKDIVTVVLLVSGINLLLRLFEMFA